MPINKIIYEDNVLIDLTEDTVTPDTLVKGVTAHDKAGNVITGIHECAGGDGAVIKTKGGWQGTPVEVGLPKNIYFNINASVEEVVNIIDIDKLNYQYLGEEDGIKIYELPILSCRASSTQSVDAIVPFNIYYFVHESLQFYLIYPGTIIEIMNGNKDKKVFFSSVENPIADFAGWVSDYYEGEAPGVFFPLEDFFIEILDVGTESDKLSSIISTTPFVQATGEEVLLEGEYDGSTVDIDVQSAGSGSGASGTPVPSSGYVEKVYFNTDLSIEEVVDIFVNAQFTPNYGTDTLYQVLFSDGCSIVFGKIQGIVIIANSITYECYFASDVIPDDSIDFVGWNPNLVNPIIINGEIPEEAIGNVGLENDKLVNLFSTTPFTGGSSEPCIDLKQYIDNKQIPLKINLTNIPSGGAVIKSPGEWEGTIVSDDSSVVDVYANTNLSVEKVVTILDTLNITHERTYGNYKGLIYYIAFYQAGSSTYDLEVCRHIDGYYVIYYGSTEIFSTKPDGSYNGWNPNFDGAIKYSEMGGNISGYNTYYGENQNDKLSLLFSSTPFVQGAGEEVLLEGEYDGSTVEVNDLSGGWQGTPVPSGEEQTIEKIYFNTNLSTEEVAKIMKEFFERHPEFDYGYAMITNNIEIGFYFSTSANTNIYYIKDYNSGQFFSSVIDIEEGVDYAGWNPKFDGVVTSTPDNEITSTNENPYISEFSSLFSITPFIKSEPNTIDMKRYIEDKKIPLNIKVNVPGGGEAGLPIEVANADEMTALLVEDNIGKIYKYTGETTEVFENGVLYVVGEE